MTEIDFTWALIGLPLVFVLGWVASRWDVKQWRFQRHGAPNAYFRGLNHLVEGQQDEAIDDFIEAVQNDPDTTELHFALGNLFRRRGDYDRAVRVHEHLLARADLTPADRLRAQHGLAQDFIRAGLLDRAEAALKPLLDTSLDAEAGLALLTIYERARDWPQAVVMAEHLEQRGHGDHRLRRTHFLCEQALVARKQADADQAVPALLEQAMALNANTPRPAMELATWHSSRGHDHEALELLHAAARQWPEHVPLLAAPLTQLSQKTQEPSAALQTLLPFQEHSTSLDVTTALASLGAKATSARDWQLRHLQRTPSLVAASRVLEADAANAEAAQADPILRAVKKAAQPLLRYRCSACGFEANQHFWQCPGCQSWDSYPPRRVEEL